LEFWFPGRDGKKRSEIVVIKDPKGSWRGDIHGTAS
jgi:hypothetical protein